MAAAAPGSIVYRPYAGESDLPSIMALVQSELSEPYVIYTYRYFLHQWYAFYFCTLWRGLLIVCTSIGLTSRFW